jgi:hypothetical protein
MESTTENTHDLIELGAASTETRGGCTGIFEFIGLILPLGLSRD